MSMKFTRRDLLKTAAAGGTVAATSSFPFINSAHAADPLSVVEWGPPWIDHAKKTGEAWGKVRDQLDTAFRWCRLCSAKNQGSMAKPSI